MKKPIALLLIVFIVVSFVQTSCVTYDLSPKDEAWNPYEVGEKLTFSSTKGAERSFTISKIVKTRNRVNVYAGNLSKLKESLTVFAIEENGSSDEVPILAIFKNSNDESFVNFILNLSGMLEINHVEEISAAEDKLGSVSGFSETDLLSINPILNVEPDVQIPYATNFVFSKSAGFMQFSLTNGETWRIKGL